MVYMLANTPTVLCRADPNWVGSGLKANWLNLVQCKFIYFKYELSLS